MLIGTTVLLLYLDWQLALVALAIVPIIAVLLVRFVSRIRPLFREVQQTLGRLNTVLQEDLLGVRVIRAFAREDYETARYIGQRGATGEEPHHRAGVLQQLPIRLSVRQPGDAGDRLVWGWQVMAVGSRSGTSSPSTPCSALCSSRSSR